VYKKKFALIIVLIIFLLSLGLSKTLHLKTDLTQNRKHLKIHSMATKSQTFEHSCTTIYCEHEIRNYLYSLYIEFERNRKQTQKRELSTHDDEPNKYVARFREFRISSPKTNLMIFQRRTTKLSIPPLYLDMNNIAIVETTKFLGLLFHIHHSSLPYIKAFIAKTSVFYHIMCAKILDHPSDGCNSKTLLSDQSLVRSNLDNGSSI